MLIATDLSSGGGVNKVIRDLAVLFRRALGTDVTVVNARSDRPSAYAFPPDIPVQFHPRQGLLSYFRLLLRLRRLKPDVVVSSWTQDNVLVTLAFLFSQTKVIVVEHSSWHHHGPAIRLLRRLVYPFASQVVVLNRADLSHYRRYLREVRLIPNPVAQPAGRLDKEKEKLIIAVGHLTPLKQFDHAIRAFAESGLEQGGWSLAIIGAGDGEVSLRRLTNELGLSRVQIRTAAEDLAPWYARASLLLVTSRIESFSLVLAEAMISGVIPIAYASDGPSFILEDFPDLLVRMDDLTKLAERLRSLANQQDLQPLRENLRVSVQSRFAPDQIVEQWRDLIDDLACHPIEPR